MSHVNTDFEARWRREEFGDFIGPLTECESEFGKHDSHEECEWLMHAMSCYDDFDDGLAGAYNREAEENMLGRPLLPNEY